MDFILGYNYPGETLAELVTHIFLRGVLWQLRPGRNIGKVFHNNGAGLFGINMGHAADGCRQASKLKFCHFFAYLKTLSKFTHAHSMDMHGNAGNNEYPSRY